MNLHTINLIAILAFTSTCNTATASNLDELKASYIEAAAHTLDTVSYNSDRFYIECTQSKTGATAICNALASSQHGRVSISMSCVAVLGADRYSVNTSTYSCKIRKPKPYSSQQ